MATQPLSASWLSTKWGIDTVRIEAMRRAGELYAVKAPEERDWRFPAWQFGDDGQVRPEVMRVLHEARARGVRADRLREVLERRSGVTGRDRLIDELLAGHVEHVLAAIRAA
jgi:hypothetical protein